MKQYIKVNGDGGTIENIESFFFSSFASKGDEKLRWLLRTTVKDKSQPSLKILTWSSLMRNIYWPITDSLSDRELFRGSSPWPSKLHFAFQSTFNEIIRPQQFSSVSKFNLRGERSRKGSTIYIPGGCINIKKKYSRPRSMGESSCRWFYYFPIPTPADVTNYDRV